MSLGGPPETKQRFPGFTGKIVVDTWRGKVRVRKWPKKRGTPKSDQVRIQNERFAEAQRLAKAAPGQVQAQAMEATKGTGLYPRDLMTKAMLSGFMDIELDDGRVIRHGRRQLFNVEFQGFILRLTANQGVPNAVTTPTTWPLPILDTAGFFDAGNPTYITVPAGVQVMEFFGGHRRTTVNSQFQFSLCERLNMTPTVIADCGGQIGGGWGFATGPVIVAEGEQYAASCYMQVGGTLLAARTFFGGRILAASV